MPLFVAAVVVARRHRTEVRAVPLGTPPLPQLIAEDLAWTIRDRAARVRDWVRRAVPEKER
jgi:hypothetical protein